MNLFSFFTRTPSSCARDLALHRSRNDRERIRAKAREMRRDMGLPPLKALGR